MKNWVITALVVIGAYATFKYVTANQAGAAANGARQGFGAGVQLGPFSAAVDLGGSGNLVAGVPSYNETVIANGHGDQVVAARHTNAMATVPGGQAVYSPAFGPNENQSDSTEVQTW